MHVSLVLVVSETTKIQHLVVSSTQDEVPCVLTCLHDVFKLDVFMSVELFAELIWALVHIQVLLIIHCWFGMLELLRCASIYRLSIRMPNVICHLYFCEDSLLSSYCIVRGYA